MSSSGARVLIVADSLALPRDGVSYENTWPAMLAAAMPDVTCINRGMRLATTERLVAEGDRGTDCLEWFQPDLVILQLGICDCAPRVLRRSTGAIVYRLPFGLGESISVLLERWRGRKVSNCYVSIAEYERNLRRYLARASALGVPVLAIAIMPASILLTEKNPGIAAQIETYNAVLDRLAAELEGFWVLHALQGVTTADTFFADGLHLNGDGAKLAAAAIEPDIRRILAGCATWSP